MQLLGNGNYVASPSSWLHVPVVVLDVKDHISNLAVSMLLLFFCYYHNLALRSPIFYY